MSNTITDRQQEILSFIESFTKRSGYPPTMREIAKEFGLTSTNGVKRHLQALEKKGYIATESNASRAISVLKPSQSETMTLSSHDDHSVEIPIVGRVAAGMPILAQENHEGTIRIDPSFIRAHEHCFALKVRGESMINAGILEGDYIIVSEGKTPRNDDIVVALHEDSATVKRYRNETDHIALIPENDAYPVIRLPKDEQTTIIGKVVGVIRWFH